MKGNILQLIAASKHREVEAMKRVMGLDMLKSMAEDCRRTPLSMAGALRQHEVAVIAEHKRRSPSRGEISAMSDIGSVARDYAAHGAAAMSVLTDTPFFGGSLEDLAVAREAVPGLPLLRKEFIVDAYQVYQARVYGADAILLIAAMISPESLAAMNNLAHSLGMETLVEIHDIGELQSLPCDADMVGVNNRDLTSFKTDIANSSRLVSSLPDNAVKVAESGIRQPVDVERLLLEGFDAFLIGEALMAAGDRVKALKTFQLQRL
ncbi:MAG: indole-3-glycerol phosphate synthase TrpC [Clostridiales bacterium]|nr:indole-3-glycerol phosphate synthase TrpC [Clostridiales bacterium]